MSSKERKDIREMIESAKDLADKDPQGFMIIKSNIEVLKTRSDMDKSETLAGSKT